MAKAYEDVLQRFAEEAAEEKTESMVLDAGINLLKEKGERWQVLGMLLAMSALPDVERRAVAAVEIKRAQLAKVPADLMEHNLALIKRPRWRPLGMSLMMGTLPDSDRKAVASVALLRALECAGGGADADEPDEDGDAE